MNITDFAASNRWNDCFQKRHSIAYRAVSGEAGNVNFDTVDDWKATPSTLIEGYEPRDTYNTKKTGLIFWVMPLKMPSMKGEACHGGKCSKDRLTVLLCCNTDGSDKLKSWVIGKYRSPRCLRTFTCCHTTTGATVVRG